MKSKLLRFLMIPALLFTLVGLTACNTMEGLGEDTAAAGDKLDKTAEEEAND